jgi:hypothetical protein
MPIRLNETTSGAQRKEATVANSEYSTTPLIRELRKKNIWPAMFNREQAQKIFWCRTAREGVERFYRPQFDARLEIIQRWAVECWRSVIVIEILRDSGNAGHGTSRPFR